VSLRRLQRQWDRLGASDPLGAILTEGRQWRPDEFFQTGRAEVEQLIGHLRSLGLELPTGTALDFGCGVGRVTQALAEHFQEVHGVDIAPSMIRLADQYNEHGSRVIYHLNASLDLRLFDSGSFDFVYSARTLQHMKPRYAKEYLRAFLRVLKPNALLFFQLTAVRQHDRAGPLLTRSKRIVAAVLPDPVVDAYRGVRHRRGWMEMHGIPVDEVVGLLREQGGDVLHVRIEEPPGWLDAQYVVRRLGFGS
jgi:2-polyprenyl-3-methyl-5-hydroxy-6-metoxy-1,4-benzoquinol methylase